MLGIKATLVTLVVGGMATGYFYIQTLRLENQLAGYDKELQYKEQLTQTLTEQLGEQKKVIDFFEQNQNKVNEQIAQLTIQKDDANERTMLAQQEIQALRSKEKQWALQDPYGSGGRAHSRLYNSLQRITGKTDHDR